MRRAYKVVERGGLVWTYMGPREQAPPLPDIESLALPEHERVTRVHQRECNWLQALEGDIDTSHFSFLHLGTLEADEIAADSLHRFNLTDRAPRYHVKDTDWGTMYTAYRPTGDGQVYHRFSHFIFPFITLPPDGTFADHIQAGIWVPMDDTHTMVFTFFWTKRTVRCASSRTAAPIPGSVSPMEFLPNGSGWHDRWRLKANLDNDYLIDRAIQEGGTYSGIQGLVAQDQAVTESMGDVVDRAREHLAPSDRMITTDAAAAAERRPRPARARHRAARASTGPRCSAAPAPAPSWRPRARTGTRPISRTSNGSSARRGRARRSRPCVAGQFSPSVPPASLPLRRARPTGRTIRCASWCPMRRADRSTWSPGWSARSSARSSARASWSRTSPAPTARSACSR